MGEWNYILLAPISAALFAIGGTGYKWARRFILPLFLAGICAINGVSWWQYLLYGGLSVAAFCLPYGSGIEKWGKVWEWVLRFLVLCSFFAPMLFVGFSWWIVVSPCILYLMFWISRAKWGEQFVVWKIWELTAGFLIGITLGGLL